MIELTRTPVVNLEDAIRGMRMKNCFTRNKIILLMGGASTDDRK